MTKSGKPRISAAAAQSQTGQPVEFNQPLRPTNKPVETEPPSISSTPHAHSKTSRLLDLLCSGTGASLEEMCEATGWQAHSVRAALTGLRKCGFAIERHVEGTTTVWRIAESAEAEVPA